MKAEINKVFIETDECFRNTCKAAGIDPTVRQASKFRRGIGKAHAYLVRHAHRGDPCIYCGTPHDQVQPGPCPGERE